MISTGTCLAIAMARCDLPLAVGPKMAKASGRVDGRLTMEDMGNARMMQTSNRGRDRRGLYFSPDREHGCIDD